jgi:hypothetical protein
MASAFETTVVAVIAIVIFYLILGSILAFTWNKSVTKVWGIQHELGVIEAIFLLITMNILFGTFSQSALVAYQSSTSKLTQNLQ